MGINEKVIDKNFHDYNLFLSSLNHRDKQVAQSLKMMYAIHMENNKSKSVPFKVIQIIRFFLKLMMVPFFTKRVIKDGSGTVVILEDSHNEEYISQQLSIPLANVRSKLGFNRHAFIIYKNVIYFTRLFFKESTLNKEYIILLLHRLIDYFMVYYTVDLEGIKMVCMENDRDPIRVALIHRSKEEGIQTIKYDNWLIDPINHNDVYCDYYFCPSLYHKEIIMKGNSNKSLRYIQGGFFIWDKLSKYDYHPDKNKKIFIYFTQHGIDSTVHQHYIQDILSILKTKQDPYEFIIKVHPREEKKIYEEMVSFKHKVIKEHEDIYILIAQAHSCFSVFSTISLEAKHIMPNSYFLNYLNREVAGSVVDYEKLGLDTVTSRKMLKEVIAGEYIPIPTKDFVKYANCTYPQTIETFKKVVL